MDHHYSDPTGTESCNVQIRWETNLQVRPAGRAGYPISLVASLDTVPVKCCVPLHCLEKGRRQRKRKERSFTSIQMLHTHTHTHPAGAGSTLKGKRKKKADTRRADGQKQRGGGNRRTSGTNLHGETDLTKTAHTPKPHDTLRRGTRGRLGTKWGTSWWQTEKQNN